MNSLPPCRTLKKQKTFINMLKNKHILLGVCGGIAAYKAVELLRLIKKAGADVKVVMTRSALEFVGETTFRVLSENDVCTGLFNSKESSVRHIDWAGEADAVVIAPATANIIGKIACGIADDALSTMIMAVRSPVMICPSMNTYMYENRAVQRNLDTLEQDGVTILEPGTGDLACKTSGAGRLPEPALIYDRLVKLFYPKDLKGKKILVSAGPTREEIDPVRYISNHSSGKMGYAVAEAAEKRGGEVTLVSGPVPITPPFGVNVVKVISARQMADEMLGYVGRTDPGRIDSADSGRIDSADSGSIDSAEGRMCCADQGRMDGADIIIKVAAVADYRPSDPKESKIKKEQINSDSNIDSNTDSNINSNINSNTDPNTHTLTIDLIENPDILRMMGERKKNQFLAGFAAETENLNANALAKIQKKNLDMIVGNIVGIKGSGFESDTNKVKFFFRDGTVDDLPITSKRQVANRLLDHIISRVK